MVALQFKSVQALLNSGWIEFLTLIVLFVTLVVLIIYTIGTYLLRASAEKQIETSYRPIIILEKTPPDKLLVRNIGSGPAFAVQVEPLVRAEYEVKFKKIPLVEVNKTSPALKVYSIDSISKS